MTGSTTSDVRTLEFRILGPFEVWRNGTALSLGGTKQRALLVLLLLHANEVVSSDQLIEWLWGDSPPSHPEHAIQVFISRLRKALGKEVLQTRAPGYRLVVEPGALDVEQFSALLEQGGRSLAAGDPEAAQMRLDEALRLWRGQPLADFVYESFAGPYVERLAELRLVALDYRIDAGLALGDHAELVAELEALVVEQPLRELLRAQLMLALYRSGRQVEALEVYQDARSRLIEDLGIEPGSELVELNRAILNHDTSLDAAPFTRRRAGNLPAPANPLIGRADELASAREILLAEDVHLLTLTGPGGTGKTRLAVELASNVVDNFADGVFFVALASVDDPKLVARAVAQTLGLSEQAGQDAEEVLRGFFPEKRILLLLDNFEQVVGAAGLLSRIAEVSAGLKLLVTSRARLRVAGERVFDVLPLRLPVDAADRLDVVAASEAGALFLARAMTAHPGFSPGDRDATTIAEICDRLDGLPLALELAAARVAILTPQALLERLERRLSVLTRGTRDADDRQQTLRGAIAWSYDLLDEAERLLFARLAVFSGGCRLEAAEAVCDADGDLGVEVLDALTSLVEKSLLRRRDDFDDEPRFWMLETIREYAVERLEQTGESDRVRRRLAEWCDVLVTRAQPELVGPNQARWRERLQADYANVRAALVAAPAAGPSTALSMVARLQEFWEPRGFLREARESLDKALQATVTERTQDRVDALAAAGWFAFCEGDLGDADVFVRSAHELATAIGYEHGAAVSLCHQAWIAYYHDEYASAVNLGNDALEISRRLDAQHEMAEALALLGNVAVATGAYADARSLLEESAALSRANGNLSALALRLADIGFIDRLEGYIAAATARFDESLALATELGQRPGRVYALLNLAAIARDDDPHTSRALAEEAITLAREMGEKSAIAQALTALAEAAAACGEDDEAEVLVRKALTYYLELADRLATIGLLEKLAIFAFRDEDVERGAVLAAAASTLRDTLDFHRVTPERSEIELQVAEFGAQPDSVFERAWSRGLSMELSDVVAEALRAEEPVSDLRA